MSMPVLLTVLDAANVATPSTTALMSTQAAHPHLLDEHHKSCASYVEAASIISAPHNYDLDVHDANVKATCAPSLRYFTVKLDNELAPEEQVGLTGDSKALGNWQLARAIVLHAQDNRLQWGAKVLIQNCQNISYRYFVFVEDQDGQKQIRRWETRLQPRQLPAGIANTTHVDNFGQIEIGVSQINRGWLTNESIVQLKFVREKMFRVIDIDRFDPEQLIIKLVPTKDGQIEETSLDNSEPGVIVEVAKMEYGRSKLEVQPADGVLYTYGDIVVFHITLPKPNEIAYVLAFYTPDQQLIGKTFISAARLTGSEGDLELAIIAPEKQQPLTKLAELSLPYVIIKPYVDEALDFRTTYAHYWPKSWPNLDVGHRGNGRSYKSDDPPPEIENTIASFKHAYEGFADMVELDVHVTADHEVVVYHDFSVCTAPRCKIITSVAQLEQVLIKDLTYEALKKLRVFAVVNGKPIEFLSHNEETRAEHRIFPTLIEVFRELPKTLGIDVEIKWPQSTASGGVEALQTIDKNLFIDRIITTVIKHGCGRPLIFSSFDADICTMLRYKQNIFPVMFLSMGETKKWTTFLDLRTRNFDQAINNAQAFELAGTAPHAEDFLRPSGAQMLKRAHDLDQITVVWGDDCNSKDRVKYFREIGATAICYDRTDLFMRDDKERSFFNTTTALAEFEGQCRV